MMPNRFITIHGASLPGDIDFTAYNWFHMSRPPRNVHSNQNPESVYSVSVPWLLQTLHAVGFDTLDFLLACTEEGLVIFSDERSEHWAYTGEIERRISPLFERRTYLRHRKRLLEIGLLREADRAALAEDKAEEIRRSMNISREDYQKAHTRRRIAKIAQGFMDGIKFEWTAWPPPDPVIQRPIAYIDRRWPVWLGNDDIAARLALMAYLAVGQSEHGGKLRATWRDLYGFLDQHVDKSRLKGSMTAKLRKGLDELSLLGLIEAGPNGERTMLDTHAFDQIPTYPTEPLAVFLGVENKAGAPLVDLVRSIIQTCHVSVTSVKTLRNALQHDYRECLLTPLDIELAQRHVTNRSTACLHTYKQLLNDFKRRSAGQGKQYLGTDFTIPMAALAVVEQDDHGHALLMPFPTSHWVNATQLFIRVAAAEHVTTAAVRKALAAVHLVVWQKQGDTVAVVPLPGVTADTDDPTLGVVLSLNVLHRQIDYGQPFELLVRTEEPNPDIRLHGIIRILRRTPRQRRRTGKSKARTPSTLPG